MPINTITAQRQENRGMSTIWLLRKFRKIRKWILKIGFQLFTNQKPTPKKKKKKKKEKAFSSFSSETPKLIIHPNPAQTWIYGIACWIKYLVDSLENIQISQRSCKQLLEQKLLISAYVDAYHVLPVNHPIVSSFDFVLNFSKCLENASFNDSNR